MLNNLSQIKKTHAFTMVELLIVVGVIAALSSLALTLINPVQLRNKASDGVRISKLSDVAEALEVYRVSEGSLPASTSTTFNPFDGPDADALASYLNAWPDDGDYSYYNLVEGPEEFLCISVFSEAATSSAACPYFKYVTPHSTAYSGGREECSGIVVVCTTPCTDNNLTNDLGNCEMLDGTTCDTTSTVNACN